MVYLCVVYCVAVWLANFVRYFANYVNILQSVGWKNVMHQYASNPRKSSHMVGSKGLAPWRGLRRSFKTLSIEMFLLSDVSGIVFEAAFGL